MDRRGRANTWLRRTLDLTLIGVVGVALFGVVLGRVVPLFGASTFVVAGGSMEPAIPLGAAVVVVPVAADELAVGDVVSLRSGPQRAVFTHRIIRIAERDGQPWLETKGDANDDADPSITPATAVLGREVAVIPCAGFLVALLSIPSGVLFVIALGVVLLMGAWMLDRDPTDEVDTERDWADDGRSPDPAV